MASTQVTVPPPASASRESSTSTTSTATTDLSVVDLKAPPTAVSLQDVEKGGPPFDPTIHPLPEKRTRFRRAWALPRLSTHRRLICLIALVNLSLLAVGIALRWYDNLPALGYLVIANISVAILIRQQRFINFLFSFATLTTTHLPLSLRWPLAKIYHFGGLHSGCAVATTIWLILFTISATILHATDHDDKPSEALLMLTYLIDLLLITIVLLALPRFRSSHHNTYEATHRFLGWTALALVWLHTVYLIRDFKPADQSLARAFFTSVSPYLLALITLSIASPWLTLRKVPVEISKPSNHVIIVSFDKGTRPAFPGSSSAISVSPLYEWHSFANVCTPGKTGFRLVISRAGDWTSAMIDKPPSHFWVRGIPTAGVANVEKLFHKVLYVCTGSGIGPVLPHLLAKEVPSRLFWSTRTPVETYGEALVDEILEASPDAVVHDTTVYGKPDMVHMAYSLAKESGAEAVIVISNQKLTRKVVYGMEARGIPAFGAIWDS